MVSTPAVANIFACLVLHSCYSSLYLRNLVLGFCTPVQAAQQGCSGISAQPSSITHAVTISAAGREK